MNKKKFLLIPPLMLMLFSCAPTDNQVIISSKCREGQIVIYTRPSCGYCVKLKKDLVYHNYNFKDYDLAKNPTLHESLKLSTHQVTVPYVFYNEKFIGGYMNFKDKCLSE